MTTVNIWPSPPRTSVTLAGGAVITVAGASALLTAEISGLLYGGTLTSNDPTGLNPNPSPLPSVSSVGDASKYVVPSGAFGVVGNGIVDDSAALNTLVSTTITNVGGTVTLQGPQTYRIAANLVFPAYVTVRFLNGAVMKPDAGVTVTILGNMDAGPVRCFDVSSGSTILLPNKVVLPEWFGAKADSGVTDCSPAILAAGFALQNSSGVVDFTASGGFYGLTTPVDWTSPSGAVTYGQFTVRGRGWDTWLKHTQVTPVGGATAGKGMLTFKGTVNNYVDQFQVENIRISGAGAGDYQEIVQWGFCNNVFFDRVKLTDNGLEGLICLNTDSSNVVQMRGCYAENIGLASFVSAYNTNAHRVIVSDCWAVNCYVALEHTGPGLTVTGCQFDGCAQRAMQIFSTSAPNEAAVITGNVIRATPQGIVVQDQNDSIGRLLITGNTLIDCAQGINVSAAGNGVCVVQNNYLIGGNPSNEAIFVGPGRHVIKDNTIIQVAGSTTLYATAASGQNLCRVPPQTSLSRGCRVNITGDAFGTRTVLDTTFAGPAAFLELTLSGTPFASSLSSGAALSYFTEQWAYCVRSGADDYHVIEGNVISGVCWTTTAFSLTGFKAVVKGNKFQQNGATTTGAGLIGLSAGATATGLQIDLATPFTYSYVEKSEVTCSGAPPVLTWKVGDTTRDPSPAAGGNLGSICTTAGTAGTLNGGATTGSISSGSAALTVNAATGLYVGCYIAIAGVAGTKQVTAISGTTITLATTAGATVAGAAVSFVAPVWKTYGAIAP